MSNNAGTLHQRFFLLPLAQRTTKGEPLFCLFAQSQVVEVVGRTVDMYPVPFAPGYLRGCILREDEVIPVLDVDALCGGIQRKRYYRVRQMLVIRTGQVDAANGECTRLALACSGTVLTFKLTDREAARPIVPVGRPEHFNGQGLEKGFFRLRGHLVVVMDFDVIARGDFIYRAGVDNIE